MGSKTSKVKIACKQCGKEFLILPSQAKLRKCCSRKCAAEYYRGENHPHYKRVKVACGQCGKEMLLTPYLVNKRRFCSRGCFRDSENHRPFGRKGFFSQPLRELQIDGITFLASVDYEYLKCQSEGIYNTVESIEKIREHFSVSCLGEVWSPSRPLPEDMERVRWLWQDFQFVEIMHFPESLKTRFRMLEKELGPKMAGQLRVLKVKPLEEEVGED